MIREGFEWATDARERCDVVIVGSGCGGATLAHRLNERGLEVIVVERGGYYTSRDFDQREANSLAKIDGGRGLETSEDGGVALTYGNNVGGASVHYWADSYRTPSDRLELWEQRFGMQLHGLADLEPHFVRLEADHGVEPASDGLVNKMNALLHQAATQLGWKVNRVPQARRFCRRSGHCMQGCAYDAKQSQLVTHLAWAEQRGARIFSDARADKILWAGRRATGIEVSILDRATGRPAGPVVRIDAKAVVVAAGGYGTPAFLLGQGLDDKLPHIGRHMFCNPCPMVHAVFDEEIVQWRNIPASWGVEEFRLARTEGDRYVEGGYLLMANQLHPGVLAAVLPGVGASHRSLMRRLPNLGGTIAWVDDADESHMTLDGARPRLHVPLDGANGLRIRDAWRKQAIALLTVGANEVLFGDAADTRITRIDQVDAAVASLDLRPGRNVLAAPHPGGGARMGADPATSVVGFDHRIHGTDNVFVTDSSVFPTPPSVDPSLSIMAFSAIASEHVAALVSRG